MTESHRRSTEPGPSPLERAAPLLRLPGGGDLAPTFEEGAVLCRQTGRRFALRAEDGFVDLLDPEFAPTDVQKALDTRLSAWVYDRTRSALAPLIGMPRFDREVDDLVERLGLGRGDLVLDLACGQGNFTVELARRVGPEGLVVGIDISSAMLRRAARHLREANLHNVLLVRGDALDLPLASDAFPRINCSGGLHQFPDLKRALGEIGRVSAKGASVTLSGFAESADDGARRFKRWSGRRFEAHFVSVTELREELRALGFVDARAEMVGRWVGYAWGHLSG